MWHWSNDSKEGSEHYLNGVQYPMEMQLYHWNTKYSNCDNAATQPDGLVAVSFFYEISEEPNPRIQDFIEATKLLEDETRHMGMEFEVPYPAGSTLDLLLPEGGIGTSDNYFHYDGSLTLPNTNSTLPEDCAETVKWIVYEKKIPISESQLEVMRLLLKGASDEAASMHPDLCAAGSGLCDTAATALAKQLRGCICPEDLMCVHNFRPIHALNPSVTARGLFRKYIFVSLIE